jgi:hypothetical protein
MVEAVSRFWRMSSLGCKCFSVVTNHATLVHLLKQSSDKLKNRQTHWAEELMPYANLMCILYMKVILNEVDPVSRRPDFLPVDNMFRPDESLWRDDNVSNIDTNDNEPALLLALSTLESLNDIMRIFSLNLKWCIPHATISMM